MRGNGEVCHCSRLSAATTCVVTHLNGALQAVSPHYFALEDLLEDWKSLRTAHTAPKAISTDGVLTRSAPPHQQIVPNYPHVRRQTKPDNWWNVN
jgi:hypothetical protein